MDGDSDGLTCGSGRPRMGRYARVVRLRTGKPLYPCDFPAFAPTANCHGSRWFGAGTGRLIIQWAGVGGFGAGSGLVGLAADHQQHDENGGDRGVGEHRGDGGRAFCRPCRPGNAAYVRRMDTNRPKDTIMIPCRSHR